VGTLSLEMDCCLCPQQLERITEFGGGDVAGLLHGNVRSLLRDCGRRQQDFEMITEQRRWRKLDRALSETSVPHRPSVCAQQES